MVALNLVRTDIIQRSHRADGDARGLGPTDHVGAIAGVSTTGEAFGR